MCCRFVQGPRAVLGKVPTTITPSGLSIRLGCIQLGQPFERVVRVVAPAGTVGPLVHARLQVVRAGAQAGPGADAAEVIESGEVALAGPHELELHRQMIDVQVRACVCECACACVCVNLKALSQHGQQR